jgi:hypothetical protein
VRYTGGNVGYNWVLSSVLYIEGGRKFQNVLAGYVLARLCHVCFPHFRDLESFPMCKCL